MEVVGYILLAALVACVLIVVIARVSKRSTNSPETSDVPASLSIRVQGREYSIPTPDADKLTAWSERKEANETNPDSCETMPGEGETLVPVSFFAPGCGLAGWSKYEDYWEACNRASWNGYNNIVVSVADYEEAEAYKAEAQRRDGQKPSGRAGKVRQLRRQYAAHGDEERALSALRPERVLRLREI